MVQQMPARYKGKQMLQLHIPTVADQPNKALEK